jgi:serine/threonine protein kinase
MGQVYRARHQSTGRIVALKVLPVELMQDESTLKRYAREITLAQQVKHPHVARVHEVSTGDTRAWYAMEYVAGVDLQRHIDQHGPISLETAADYVLQVARVLVYLHELAVIHRDIKPANLILTPEGRIKVVDLGLARCEVAAGGHSTDLASQLTTTGMAMGTVDYIAPEQILDAKSVDGRADLYSLGCVFYYLVHGRPPFQRETEVETLLAHTEASIPTLSNRRDSNARM